MDYHLRTDTVHVNALGPRAYFIPYPAADATALPRELSPYFHSLDGSWSFGYFPDADAIGLPDDTCPTAHSGVAGHMDAVTEVPSCWQTAGVRGTDEPQYINQDYPFPVDPPRLPDAIPCGVYERRFSFEKKEGKKHVLVFEGVAPCLYVWVNGGFIGYGSVSHSTNEFDVTDALTDGENTVTVLVMKYCVGTYFEDQDFFRLNGIFRSVYILDRDENCLENINIISRVSADLGSAKIKVAFDAAEDLAVEGALLAPGATVPVRCEAAAGEGLSFSVQRPALWNPEKPVLYTLLLTAGSEYFMFRLALRRAEIKDGTFLLNGRKIKLRGVNRHDTDPETGYCVTPSQMEKELLLLKNANVNTVRTSHYPNDPRFPALCDKYGIMLVDECDLETHGMGYNFGDWKWDRWADLCDKPEYRDICLDRIARLYERDRNHGCVVMWSLGNESGCGENHRAMANYIRSRDPEAIVHYENAHLEYAARLGKDFSDISDVESRMYASIDYAKSYLEDPQRRKPFFYCEYLDSTHIGDIYKYWEELGRYDGFMGACFWELHDHAVNVGTRESPRYRYGSDFDVYPRDDLGCIDGIVFPDGEPSPLFADLKQAYCPYRTELKDGYIVVRNTDAFTDMSAVNIEWSIVRGGEKVSAGTITSPDIPAGKSRVYGIFDYDPADPGKCLHNCDLIVSYVRRTPTPWAEKGSEVGFEAFENVFEPAEPVEDAPPARAVAPTVSDRSRMSFTVLNGEASWEFSVRYGLTAAYAGTRRVFRDACFIINRPLTYGTQGLREVWERARFPYVKPKCLEPFAFMNGEVRGRMSLGAAGIDPLMTLELTYIFLENGGVRMKCGVDVDPGAPPLPRFGLMLTLPESFEDMSFTGRGPLEAYADRYRAQKPGIHAGTVTGNYVHYIRPQECGSHFRTRRAALMDSAGRRLTLSSPGFFCFNALHFTPEKLAGTRHDDELRPDRATYVYADFAIDCPSESARRFDDKHFDFVLDIC